MPHFSKPFFRKSRGLWYVQLDGTQHNLGPDRDAAFKAYRDLIAQPAPKPVLRGDHVAGVIGRYRIAATGCECGERTRIGCAAASTDIILMASQRCRRG